MKVVTSDQMRQAETRADASGLSFARMMENAGQALATEIGCRAPVQGRAVLVLVGPGNNGGDGLVAARCLHDAHASVSVYLWQARPETDLNANLVYQRGIAVHSVASDPGLARLSVLAQQAEVIVDALLGTGAARPIAGDMKAMLNVIRDAAATRADNPPFIVAVDLPSGLNADSGAIDPAAVAADLTVTFAYPKRGHYLFPGAAYVGELVVADIGIAPDHLDNVSLEAAEPRLIAELLPRRPRDAHKGTFGKLLVIAGCANYTGAAYLAATAAYRVGAGLVTLALARSLHPILAAKTSEVTFLPLPEAEPGYIGSDALPVLLDALTRYDAVLVGCGLGAHAQTRSLVVEMVNRLGQFANLRAIIDADGLNALAASSQWWAKLPANVVLTPHAGEMSRLSGLSIEAITGDRIRLAAECAATWKQVVALKGAFTVVASPGGDATINPFANPALATAGTGDVLAGAIGGLLAQGVDPYRAAVAGAYLHGRAAEIAGQRIGETGMVASDLLPILPLAISDVRQSTRRIGRNL